MSESGNFLDNAEVDFLIDGGGGEEPPPEPGQPDEQAVTMRGDLDQINLSDIFQTLALTKMEGVLRVRNPLEQRQVYCNDGYVRILVPTRIATRRLGQRLVKAGLLQPEHLRSALLKQRREPMPLGALLVAEGLIAQDQVDEIAGMQVAEDLFALFTWRHGTFEFYKGTIADPVLQQQFEKCPEFEVSSLLLEVARRSDEWESILGSLCSLDEVPARIADVPTETELGEIERGLLFGADGRLTYRQLADQTTHGLFEVARVARDLVRTGCLANVGDDELIAVAEIHAESEQPKQALMLLQTLRDRSGERSLATLNRMVAVLDKAGERKLAGTMLLEVAQQQTNPDVALPLARKARELAPTDPGTISFLRTTLLVHAAADSTELDRCTLDLIDALLAIDKADTAIEIVDEVRAAGAASMPIMVREARARQKVRDVPGATKVLFDLGELYRAQNDKKRAIEAYESILRLDRTRKDVQKLLRQIRQTRTDRIVRGCAAGVVACLLGAMGFVVWQQNRLDDAMHSAALEIGELLRSGDRVAARERFEHWAEVIDEPEHVADLKSQVDFADASELTRLNKLNRKRMHERLTQAAETLNAGDLRGALSIYSDLCRLPDFRDFRDEVIEVTATRIDAELVKIEQVAKAMAGRLPPEPNTLLDRAELTANNANLQTMCPTALLRVVDDLRTVHGNGALPPFLAAPIRNRVAAVLEHTREVFDRASGLTQAYAVALQTKEEQRRLDPMFKKAKQLEEAWDFAAALDLYRQIDQAEASEDMRAHFRDRVASNEAIVRGMQAVTTATAAGDFPAAQQHYRALRAQFSNVPFDRFVRLPLRVESLPSGAAVQCNGAAVGHTPCTLAYLPADDNRLAISLAGFQAETQTVTGDEIGRLQLRLLLEPLFVRKQDMIEAPPALDDRGRIFLVDRGGVITALDRNTGRDHWTFPTGDLSGLLSQPFVHGDHVVVASLDGELRALDRASGKPVWTLPNLPTEVGPVLVDHGLAIATTGKRLTLVDLSARTVTGTDLPEMPRGKLLARGQTIFWCGDGAVGAYTLPTLTRLWHQPLPEFGEKSLVLLKNGLLVGDDRGHLEALDLQDGHRLWQKSLDTEALGAPIVADDEILVGSPRRILRFAAADGKDRPPIAVGDAELAGPPHRVGSRLLAPTRDGLLQVFDAAGHALYRLEGHKRGAQVLAADGIVLIVLPERRVHFFGALR